MSNCAACSHPKNKHGIYHGPNSIGKVHYTTGCTHGAKVFYLGEESDMIRGCRCPKYKKSIFRIFKVLNTKDIE